MAVILAATPADALTRKQIEQCTDKFSSADVAIQACTAAIRSGQFSEKEAAPAFFVRGFAYEQKGEDDRAISDFTEAIRLDRADPDAFVKRGVAYSNKGEYDRAISDFNEAIRLDPNDQYAFNDRGLAYDKRNESDRAIADYSEAIRLAPGYSDALDNRGIDYAIKGDLDRAIADFGAAIKADPNDATAFYLRGLAWRDKGDRERAITDLKRAAELGDAEARTRLKELQAPTPANRPGRSSDLPVQSGAATNAASTAAGGQCTDKADSVPAWAGLIESGRLSGSELAEASLNRCRARALTGNELRQALAHCDEPLKIRPN